MISNKFKKLVVFDNIILTDEQLKRLKNCAEEIVFYPFDSNPENIKEKIKDADALINCWTVINKDALIGSKIRYIGNWGHWWKHRITLSEKELKNMNIHLDYIPDYGTDSVAEIVWAGILSLSKNLERWHKDCGTGKWTYENIKRGDKKINISEVEEKLLKNQVLGIVGLGRIGYRVAKIGKDGFGMKVFYNSRTRKKDAEKEGIEFLPLDELFKKCDIISIHTPPEIEDNFISENFLNSMKKGAIFINTSTGNAVDQDALIKILKEGKIKAFLDVYRQFPPKNELKNLPNVLFTYRLGWFTKDSLEKKGETLVSNIEKFLSNKIKWN